MSQIWKQIRGCNNSQPSNDHCWYSSHQCTCENHQEGPSCESCLWPKSKTSFAQSHLQVTSLCPMSPHLCQHHHLHRIRKFKTKTKKTSTHFAENYTKEAFWSKFLNTVPVARNVCEMWELPEVRAMKMEKERKRSNFFDWKIDILVLGFGLNRVKP